MLTVWWPDYFDDYASVVESKGVFEDVTVEWNGARIRPVFYDPARLSQTISDELAHGSYFREPNLIVIEKVTHDHMEASIAALSEQDLARLIPE